MPRAVSELRQIPFGYLIGAPLKAAIEAQALAAKTTVEFIEKVGFKETNSDVGTFTTDLATDADAGEIRNVTFRYTKVDETKSPPESSVELTVPILSIVPIPYLRLDEITIDFAAKLTDTIASTTKTGFNLSTEAKGKFKSWWSPLSLEFRTSMSYSSSREQASKFVREYTMNIHVRAVQEGMPAGLERILDILEQTIREKPTTPTP